MRSLNTLGRARALGHRNTPAMFSSDSDSGPESRIVVPHISAQMRQNCSPSGAGCGRPRGGLNQGSPCHVQEQGDEGADDEAEVEEAEAREQPQSQRRATTCFMVNCVSVMERMDEQILPAVSRFLGCSWAASPQQLGAITFGRAAVQALASPLGGLAGYRHDRIAVIALGCAIWSACTCTFAFSTSVRQGAAVWALNGLGLSLIIPNCQSLVADYHTASTRGAAFGALTLTSALGGMAGSLFATNLAAATLQPAAGGGGGGGNVALRLLPRRIAADGWRLAFLVVGAVSLIIGLLTWLLGDDPRPGFSRLRRQGLTGQSVSSLGSLRGSSGVAGDEEGAPLLLPQSKCGGDSSDDAPLHSHTAASTAAACGGTAAAVSSTADVPGASGSAVTCTTAVAAPPPPPPSTAAAVRRALAVPTFLIIVFQGIVGSTPWNAAVFFTLFLQLGGLSDLAASLLLAAWLLGGALGGLAGGLLGDWAARRSPDHGRIWVAQASVAAGIPLSFVLLKGMPLPAELAAAADGAADGGGDGQVVAAAAAHLRLAWAYAAVLFLFGLMTSWCAPGCNNPVFAEIVPHRLRNIVYAFDRSFEGAVSAMGAPLVGLFAERFYGFSGTAAVGGPGGCSGRQAGDAATPPPQAAPAAAGGSSTSSSLDALKARALGNAMLFWFVAPWTLCFFIYSALHWTYPRDRRRAAAGKRDRFD